MLRVSVVLAAGVLMLSACSASDHPSAAPSTRSGDAPDVAQLDVAWQRGLAGDAVSDFDDSRGDPLWAGDGTVSVVTDSVTTYDAATGDRLSSVQLDGHVCAVSREASADGIGAVALGRGCRTIVAVDTVAGKIVGKWDTGHHVYLQDVSVGEHVVVAADASSGARRFDLRSGRELPRLGPGSAASDGTLIVVADGPSFHQTFEVYDQDSGRLLKEVPAGANVDIYDILGHDPLLVAAHTNDAGDYVMDLSGRHAAPSGRRIDPGYPSLAGYQVLDHTLFVQYGDSPVLDTWDHGVNELAPFAVLRATEGLVGTHDGDLITVQPSGDPLTGRGSVVRALDPADPGSATVLGTAGAADDALVLSTTAEVVGDLLVTPVDGHLVALRLPDDGVPQSDLDTASGLSADDYTSADVGDLCPGLREATLRALGIRTAQGGYRADCTFLDPGHLTFVSVSAFASTAQDGLEPVDVAKHTFTNTVKASGSNNLPPLTPLPGLGDQAAWGQAKHPGAGLLIRVGNATIIVQGSGLVLAPGTSMKEALRAVGEDLVAELGRRHDAR